MKWIWLVVLLTFTALTTGCGGNGGNGVSPVEPNYTTGLYGMEFTAITDEGKPADGIPFKTSVAHITETDTTFTPFNTATVKNGSVIVDSLSRGVDYGYSFLDEQGNPIPFEIEGKVVDVLILRLDEGEDLRELYIPVFYLRPKPLPPTGALKVESIPAGAAILFNNEDKGRVEDKGVITPFTFTNLPIGEYQVLLELEGYELWSDVKEVRADETTNFSATLQAHLPHGFDPDEVPWEGEWARIGGGGRSTVRFETWPSGTWIAGFTIGIKKVGKQLIAYPDEDETGIDFRCFKDDKDQWVFYIDIHKKDGREVSIGYIKKT